MFAKDLTERSIINQAVFSLLKREPFWANVLASLPIHIEPGEASVKLNGLAIHIGSEYFKSMQNPSLLEGILLNQILKIILLQASRQQKRQPDLWNLACNIHNAKLLAQNSYPIPPQLDPIIDQYQEFLQSYSTEEELYEILKQQWENSQETTEDNENNPDDESGDESDGNSNNESDKESDDDSDDESGDESDDLDGESSDGDKNQDSKEDQDGQDSKGENTENTEDKNQEGQNEQESSGKSQNQDGEGQKEDKESKTTPEIPGNWQKINELMGQMEQVEEQVDENNNSDGKPGTDPTKQVPIVVNQLLILGQRMGNVPAMIQQEVDKLRRPKQSLLQVLERFVAKGIEPNRYNWQRSNLRYSQDFFIPKIEGERSSGIACAFDTSGSFWGYVEHTMGLVLDIWERAGRQEPIHVLYCDWEIHHQTWKSRRDILVPKGGGGTSFAPIMAWINKNAAKYNLQAALYVTDGECDEFGPRPIIPLFWIFVPVYKTTRFYPPFGKVITVPPKEFLAQKIPH